MFLDFISYSGGPLPEDLLKVIKVPVTIGWGVQDPWEPIEQGRAYADYDSVEVRSCHGWSRLFFIAAASRVSQRGRFRIRYGAWYGIGSS